MTTKELIKFLQQFPTETEVLIADISSGGMAPAQAFFWAADGKDYVEIAPRLSAEKTEELLREMEL